jgi:hypothetical protein
MPYNFNLMNYTYIENNIDNCKNINQIAFYFVEGGPGRSSEDIKKECNVNCLDFSSFLSPCWKSWVEKSQST